eukprot:CAMPEP_0175123004 /NCGR_PEP_ID=MMETSP0087-20121206/2011_1 /TAXON_ID=136419 /ORGANISM="Unknown Unknown, Strain D1" /LENGTH=347 /DNA_ID=CAMNT_0016404665 /DNA_START=32 /DNA_END=1075 /DNA_ORIENTATION=-
MKSPTGEPGDITFGVVRRRFDKISNSPTTSPTNVSTYYSKSPHARSYTDALNSIVKKLADSDLCTTGLPPARSPSSLSTSTEFRPGLSRSPSKMARSASAMSLSPPIPNGLSRSFSSFSFSQPVGSPTRNSKPRTRSSPKNLEPQAQCHDTNTPALLRSEIAHILDEVNAFRKVHKVPPLLWSEDCYNSALKQAIVCFHNTKSIHGNMWGRAGRHGQTVCHGRQGKSVRSAVEAWYSESARYDHSQPGFRERTNNFVQMVWASTTHIGLARVASTASCNFMVANYWPPPTFGKDAFEQNVHRPDRQLLQLLLAERKKVRRAKPAAKSEAKVEGGDEDRTAALQSSDA